MNKLRFILSTHFKRLSLPGFPNLFTSLIIRQFEAMTRNKNVYRSFL